METGQRKELYQGGNFGSRLHISPDGQQLAFTDEDWRALKVIAIEGGEPAKLLNVGSDSNEIDESVYPYAWTADRRHLLFLKERWLAPDDSRGWRLLPWELWRIPAEGGEPRKLLTAEELMPGANLWASSFHPDGRHIAFRKSIRSNQEHWAIDNLLSVFAAER